MNHPKFCHAHPAGEFDAILGMPDDHHALAKILVLYLGSYSFGYVASQVKININSQV